MLRVLQYSENLDLLGLCFVDVVGWKIGQTG